MNANTKAGSKRKAAVLAEAPENEATGAESEEQEEMEVEVVEVEDEQQEAIEVVESESEDPDHWVEDARAWDSAEEEKEKEEEKPKPKPKKPKRPKGAAKKEAAEAKAALQTTRTVNVVGGQGKNAAKTGGKQGHDRPQAGHGGDAAEVRSASPSASCA